MANTIGKFDFELTKMDKTSPMPFDPQVALCLKTYGRSTRDGAPIVSANLASEGEIDEYVRQLQEDLAAVAVKAKTALRKARESTMKIVEGRLPPSET